MTKPGVRGNLVKNGRNSPPRRRNLTARRESATRFMRQWVAENMRETDECVLWDGAVHSRGYGRYNLFFTHRLSYELLVGPIPEGLHLDHLCCVKLCCNPRHLEPVTHEENVRRYAARFDERCGNGHERTPDSTYFAPGGKRYCRACRSEADRLRRARRAA